MSKEPKAAKVSKARTERIEIRCHEEEKELLRRAAMRDDRTLSNWLLHVTLREARRAVVDEGVVGERRVDVRRDDERRLSREREPQLQSSVLDTRH